MHKGVIFDYVLENSFIDKIVKEGHWLFKFSFLKD